jgi:carboxylate-amine ligase
VTDLPRYRSIGFDYPWATRRGLPTGLHVHVAIDDPDAALAVYNACRGWLPELAALAANSPFYQGADSGLASTRLKLIEDMPRSGIPPSFDSWLELSEFATWGTGAGLFPDLTYLWWDLRLRPEYGTLEFRVADAQTGLDASAAIAAICQSLVAALRARLDANEPLPVYRTHVLNENRWRALRDGLDAQLVDPATGVSEPARSRLARLLELLEPHAADVGCATELAHAWTLLVAPGAARQRAVAEEHGVTGLLAWLVEETEQPDAPA